MTYKFTKTGIEREYVPERDLFRLVKYGTYDLLELDGMLPDGLEPNELTDEEHDLIYYWYLEYSEEMTDEEAFE